MTQKSYIPKKSAGKTNLTNGLFLPGNKKNELFLNFDGNPTAFLRTQTNQSAEKEEAREKLPDKLARKMGYSVGEDFSGVRIHTNSELAKEMNALAFTGSNEISFAPGKYDPETATGQELIGHELIHVTQQKNREKTSLNQGKKLPAYNDRKSENEADNLGKQASRGQKVTSSVSSLSGGHAIIQRKENNNSTETAIADRSGDVNSGTNIIGGILDRFNKNLEAAEKIASKAMKEAQAAERLAISKAAKAKKAIRAAGSGKSKILSEIASTAAKEANEAKRIAYLKHTKAMRLFKEAKRIKSLLPVAVKVLNKLPLNTIGFAAAFANKYLTTTNTTTAGKLTDSGITAGFDLAFGSAHPVVSAIDAIIGLVPGGERVNISNTMSNSISSITGSAESILTGDISGLEKLRQDAKAGKSTWIFEQAFKAGDYWAENGGTERAQMVGDFWGGADTVSGRATGFLAAMPGIGHAGEGLGWLAFQGYDKGGDALNYAGNKLAEFDETIMPEGRTLNPLTGLKSLFKGENPFW